MDIFATEQEMQDWISVSLEKSEGLAELITNIDEFEEISPGNHAEAKIIKSIKIALESLYLNHKLSENENISSNSDEILKPDFVMYAPETESIVVIELKNLVSPSRQAGTELAAYTSAIRNYIPLLSEGDVVHVLISTKWSTLLVHYARSQIYWQGKNLVCLRPIFTKYGEKKLEILFPEELIDSADNISITSNYIGGYQICLYPKKSSADNNVPIFDEYIEQFKTAIQAMASEGNRLNGHGFAYLWRDRANFSMAPYSITVMNIAPFHSNEIYGALESEIRIGIYDRFSDILREFNPQGHGNALNLIRKAGCEFVENICDAHPEAFATWSDHKFIMGDRADKVAFVAWGLFGEAMSDHLLLKYKAGQTSRHFMCPEMGDAVVNQLVRVAPQWEARLRSHEKLDEASRRNEFFIGPVPDCNYCKKSLTLEGYFADAKEIDSTRWGFMCADCFAIKGEGIAAGKGQLYKKLENEGWLLVGGFL